MAKYNPNANILKRSKITNRRRTTRSNCNSGEVELWGGCYNIETTTNLNLSNSGLTGQIPSEIGDLINLTIVGLQDNQLTGQIPPEIFNLPHLHMLVLRNNQLSGQIPDSIGNMGKGFSVSTLGAIDLSNNQLSGWIPDSIGDISMPCFITGFNLSNNQLTIIPDKP